MGVLLFFDNALLAIGNLLFLAGTSLLIGVKNTGGFFFQRSKARGTSLFLVGILLVIFKWPKIGFFMEVFGFINLFGNFFPQVIPFLRAVPGINKVLDLPAVHTVLAKISQSASKHDERPSV